MEEPRYVVRHMTPNDLQEVRDLHGQLFPVKYGTSFFKKLLDNPEGNIVSLVLVDTSPGDRSQKVVGVATCRVATVEDSIVGFLLGRKEACKEKNTKTNHLILFYLPL